MLDIGKLDEWLLHNPDYSQEERELIVKAIEEYELYLWKGKQL